MPRPRAEKFFHLILAGWPRPRCSFRLVPRPVPAPKPQSKKPRMTSRTAARNGAPRSGPRRVRAGPEAAKQETAHDVANRGAQRCSTLWPALLCPGLRRAALRI